MAGGIERLAQQLAEVAERRVLAEYESSVRLPFGSPIERLFYVGLCEYVRSGELLCFESLSVARGDEDFSAAEREACDRGGLLLLIQRQLLDWRADFVLSAPSESQRKLIIECDGHDFHERTKEQAARDRGRDRAAIAAGHRILRFTGSELFRDPLNCVREALKHTAWLGGWDDGSN